jgi:hypothetical protein
MFADLAEKADASRVDDSLTFTEEQWAEFVKEHPEYDVARFRG